MSNEKFIIMKTKIQILLITTIVFLCSCSPQRRLERLIAHHPELCITDTLCIRDSVILPAVTADTAVSFSGLVDPVIIKKERLEIEVQKVHDTLYIRGKCKADTMYKTLRVPVEKIRLVKTDTAGMLIRRIPWLIAGFIVFAAFIAFLVMRFLPARNHFPAGSGR